MKTLFLFIILFSNSIVTRAIDGGNNSDSINIVILGSSTAFGAGAIPKDSSWVNRYKKYVQSINPKINIINLAVGGYTTYNILPDSFKPIKNRPLPSTNNNITKALKLLPTAIIINLPSNDASRGYSINEQISNYKIINRIADSAYIPLWVATTQPCNRDSLTIISLKEMRDSTYSIWGNNAIDFWTGIANENGKVIKKFDSGDGIHLNNAGHKLLFNRVVNEILFEKK